ncbi:MAG: HU family DNA-binding protein [Rhodospirillaceae bacterium]
MNKTGFVAVVANKANLTQAEAGRLVDAVLAAVTETLACGEDIRLTGFGSFEVVEQAARTGRNPRTGQEIAIPASKAPKFRAGAALKTAVGGTSQEG